MFLMIIDIHGIGIKVGEGFESTVRRQMQKFDRYFGDEAHATVRFQHEHEDIRTEVTIKVRSHLYRAEAIAPEAIMSLQKAIDVMEGQIRKQKTRMKKQNRNYDYMREYIADIEASLALDEEEEEMPIITRRKSFVIAPMDANEAVLQMELLDHTFFLFLNPDSGKVNLVYKRLDGNYGLLEPKY